jgi:hypothetical protein
MKFMPISNTKYHSQMPKELKKLDEIIDTDIATPNASTSCPCFGKIWRRWKNCENYFIIEMMVNLLAQNIIFHLLTNI